MALTSEHSTAEDCGLYILKRSPSELCLDSPLHKCDTGFGTDACAAWVLKSISALCCGHRSNLVACVKRKHAFPRVPRCSQICQSERRVLTFIFVKVKSLSSKPTALKHRTAFQLDINGGKKTPKPTRTLTRKWTSTTSVRIMVACERLFVWQYTRVKKFLLICIVTIPFWR